MEFLDFWVFGLKFTKFLNLKEKQQVSFSLNFAWLFNVMRDNSFVLFSWNFTWFLQKEPIKVQYFRLLTAQVKFHQICTLIGSFCWKYIKFQLKKVQRSYIYLMILKSDAKFEEKLIFCFKNDKNLVNFDLSTEKSKKSALWLVPFVWPKKKEKLICGLENDVKNLANFHQNTFKVSKLALSCDTLV